MPRLRPRPRPILSSYIPAAVAKLVPGPDPPGTTGKTSTDRCIGSRYSVTVGAGSTFGVAAPAEKFTINRMR